MTLPEPVAVLLAAAITSAGNIVAALIKRGPAHGETVAKRPAASFKGLQLSQGADAIVQDGARKDCRFDGEFLKDAIDSAFERLEALIATQVKEFKVELRKERTRQLVVSLQAKVAALKNLIVLQDSDSGLTGDVVKSAIFPLRAAIEEVTADVGEASPHLMDYCLIVGNSALVAAYGYLGHDAKPIRLELEMAVRRVQTSLLDQIALERLKMGIGFPWERVPRLLEAENAHELRHLYLESMEQASAGSAVQKPVKEVRQLISDTVDIRELQVLERVERASRGRATVLEALAARIRKLEKTRRI